MLIPAIVSICIGASSGALLRWWFGIIFNSYFPTIPLGTLIANLLGGFLMGIFIGISKIFPFIPETVRLAIVTGFLGGLTTFSTFSGEAVTLLSNEEYLWASLLILSHVVGSIAATIAGIYAVKFLLSLEFS
ncbi:MAG: fluoride efflux transporter CrcB [Chlamydiota bacterium]